MSEVPTPQPESQPSQKRLSVRDRIRQYFNPADDKPANASRRDFVGNVAKAGMVLPLVSNDIANGLADFAEGIDLQKNKEKAPQSVQTEFIDFTYKDVKSMTHQLLGSEDRSDKMDVTSQAYAENHSAYFMSSDPAEVKTAILNKMLTTEKGHGDLTTGSFVQTAEQNGFAVETPHITPLEPAISTSFEYDDLGNITAKTVIDTNVIAEAIRKLPTEVPIINMSLIVGESQEKYIYRYPKDLPKSVQFVEEKPNDAFYILQSEDEPKYFKGNTPVDKDGNELEILTEDEYNKRNAEYHQASIAEYKKTGSSAGIETVRDLSNEEPSFLTERIEAYNEALAAENLKKLAALANQFPEKTFICAGGNKDDNFYWARKDIESQSGWPDNLLIVGTRNVGGVEADGCDFYLYQNDFKWLNDGGDISASEATAVVSSLANSLNNELKTTITDDGIRAKTVRRILRLHTTSEAEFRVAGDVSRGETEKVLRKGRKIEPKLYQQVFQHLKQQSMKDIR